MRFRSGSAKDGQLPSSFIFCSVGGSNTPTESHYRDCEDNLRVSAELEKARHRFSGRPVQSADMTTCGIVTPQVTPIFGVRSKNRLVSGREFESLSIAKTTLWRMSVTQTENLLRSVVSHVECKPQVDVFMIDTIKLSYPLGGIFEDITHKITSRLNTVKEVKCSAMVMCNFRQFRLLLYLILRN